MSTLNSMYVGSQPQSVYSIAPSPLAGFYDKALLISAHSAASVLTVRHFWNEVVLLIKLYFSVPRACST